MPTRFAARLLFGGGFAVMSATAAVHRPARQSLAEQPLPALRSEVRQRIVFADSVAAGRLARETAPDSAAAREIAALVDELLRWPT